jgi:hypothetical protein
MTTVRPPSIAAVSLPPNAGSAEPHRCRYTARGSALSGNTASSYFLAICVIASLSGCVGSSPTPTPEPTPTPTPAPTPAPILVITTPEDGDVVRSPSVQVVGTAPAGAEIVQELNLFGDRRTSADDKGDWVLTVDLEEGDNDLVFRIGDDEATTKTLRIVYEPET